MVHDRARREPAPSGVPSEVSRARLAREVEREVADLRVRLSEASLRSTALEQAGLPGAAAEVVAEQRDLLDGFRHRLEDAVAAAVVEREAELVFAAELARTTPETEPRRLPAALSAALAVAAAIALAVGSGESFGTTPATSGDAPRSWDAEEARGGGGSIAAGQPNGAGGIGLTGAEGVAHEPGSTGPSMVTGSAAPPAEGVLDELLRVVELELDGGLAATEQPPPGVPGVADGDEPLDLTPSEDGGEEPDETGVVQEQQPLAPDDRDTEPEPQPSGADLETEDPAAEETPAADDATGPASPSDVLDDDDVEPGFAEPQSDQQIG